MAKIAAVGDAASVYGFGALGVAVYPVEDEKKAGEAIERLCASDTAVIFVTEQYALSCREQIERLSERITPAILPIPGAAENNGIGVRALEEAVLKAVGTAI